MSGIFLIVWNDTDKDKCAVLKPTKGGYPHITVAYTGKNLSQEALVSLSTEIFSEWALKNVTLKRAYVNSFKPENGPTRHDVLIEIGEMQAVEDTRTRYLRGLSNHNKFSMNAPHVTHAIYSDLAEAENTVEQLNKFCLPLIVHVTGVSID
jgi:hypothetical protein